MADTAAAYGVAGQPSTGLSGHAGSRLDGPRPRKLGALGLRVEKGVTFHGIALNVTTDLDGFALIDPCGMAGLDVTSIARELGWTGDAARAVDRERAAGRRALRRCVRLAARRGSDALRRARPRPGGLSPTRTGHVRDARRPLRAAARRHHRLVGRGGRRPGVRSRPLRAPSGARGDPGRRTARTAPTRRPTGRGSAC